MRSVRVVTPQAEYSAHRISGAGTLLLDAETGSEIRGVTRIAISIAPNEFVRAEVDINLSSVEVGPAIGQFMVAHPLTGERKQVKTITFADGETVSF